MKEVECARVDGSYDEGPSHLEVQYWWTLRPIETQSQMVLVMSRNSGACYKNRVELQNGCACEPVHSFYPKRILHKR